MVSIQNFKEHGFTMGKRYLNIKKLWNFHSMQNALKPMENYGTLPKFVILYQKQYETLIHYEKIPMVPYQKLH